MDQEHVDLDALLDDQSAQATALLATIERVAEDDDRVRLTPFVADVGCLCSVSLTVNKKAVGTLKRTAEVHRCCGKNLAVVEVDLLDDTLKDVFSQLLSRARTSAPEQHTDAGPGVPLSHSSAGAGVPWRGPFPGLLHGHSHRYHHFDLAVMLRAKEACHESYEECMKGAASEFDRCLCSNAYASCLYPSGPLKACDPAR